MLVRNCRYMKRCKSDVYHPTEGRRNNSLAQSDFVSFGKGGKPVSSKSFLKFLIALKAITTWYLHWSCYISESLYRSPCCRKIIGHAQVLRVIKKINNAQKNVNKQHARKTMIPCYQIFASVGAYTTFHLNTVLINHALSHFQKHTWKHLSKGSTRIADK